MDRIFRIKEVNGDTSFQDKTLTVGKKKINLLIVLDDDSIEQFSDVKNDIWVVKYIRTFADIQFFKDLNKMYEYKNICIVHHGNTFSDRSFNDSNIVHLHTVEMREIKKAISAVGEQPIEINDEYVTKVFEKSKTITKYTESGKLGVSKKAIQSFFSLKLIIEQLLDNGCLFSVACWEAKNPEFLIELASFSDKNIKIFGSTNYVNVSHRLNYPTKNPVVANYGSILNHFLTSPEDWIDGSGWKYYDSKLKTVITTNKDLWLFSKNSSEIFELISRKKILTIAQEERDKFALQYFSKKWKTYYVKQNTYENWKKSVEVAYPDFKN